MKTIFLIAIIFSSLFCKAQDYRKCIVYQFTGRDSADKHIALVQTFNERGQVVSETYSDYRTSSMEFNFDGTYFYDYTDTLLTEKLFINSKKDSTKVLYYYNALNQCIREEYHTCERRIRKDVKKGYGQPGGCLIFDKDFDSVRTWRKRDETTYEYDNKSRRNKKYVRMDYDKVWQYDSLNRITQEKAYSEDRLAYVSDYKYFQGGYRSSEIHYNDEGEPEPPKYSDIIFSPIYTTTYFLDNKNRIVEETMTTEKGVKIYSELTYYDAKGRIARTFNHYLDKHYIRDNEQPETTHIFEYE